MKFLKSIKFCLFLALFFGIERLCHRATDGFALVNIYSAQKKQLVGDMGPELGEFKQIFDQPFYYLDSGSQSYVFLSEDGDTILKFFKFQHMRIPLWIDMLPLPKSLAKKRALKKEKKRKVLTATLNSYKIAYERLREDAALLFIHLAPSSNLHQTVTLYDKIGKRHVIDLNRVEFILQRKAELAYNAIDRWMAFGEHKKAEKGIQGLFELTLSRCQQGIFDKDPDFSTNFGFIGEKPVQIDVGRFSLEETEKNAAIYRAEIIRITRNFHKWIEKNHRDLLDSFDRELEKITSHS